jgi:hypothetical protein
MAQMPSQQTDDDFRGLSLRYTLFFGCSDLIKIWQFTADCSCFLERQQNSYFGKKVV